MIVSQPTNRRSIPSRGRGFAFLQPTTPLSAYYLMVGNAAWGGGGGIDENDCSHPYKVDVKNTWSLSMYLSGVKDRDNLNIPK